MIDVCFLKLGRFGLGVLDVEEDLELFFDFIIYCIEGSRFLFLLVRFRLFLLFV